MPIKVDMKRAGSLAAEKDPGRYWKVGKQGSKIEQAQLFSFVKRKYVPEVFLVHEHCAKGSSPLE